MTTIRERAKKLADELFIEPTDLQTEPIEAALREFGEELAKKLDIRAKECRDIAAKSRTDLTRRMWIGAASEAELQALNIRAAIRESL